MGNSQQREPQKNLPENFKEEWDRLKQHVVLTGLDTSGKTTFAENILQKEHNLVYLPAYGTDKDGQCASSTILRDFHAVDANIRFMILFDYYGKKPSISSSLFKSKTKQAVDRRYGVWRMDRGGQPLGPLWVKFKLFVDFEFEW